MKAPLKLNWLLRPVFTGLLVAFIFILAQYIFAGSGSTAPLSGAGEFRQLENNYQIAEKYLPSKKVEPITPPKETKSPQPAPVKVPVPQRENKHLNQTTDNLNVLFLGVDGDKLLMCSIYSINHQDKMQSGAVFTPTFGLAPGMTRTFAEVYKESGADGIRKLMEDQMEITIAYYVVIENAVFAEVEKFIDPIYVDQEKVNLADLFTMKVGPKDQEILGALMQEFSKPKVFFIDLPRLVFHARKYITTDFAITPQNLMLHYKIVREVDTTKIRKVVLPGRRKYIAGMNHYELLPYPLQNTICELTQ